MVEPALSPDELDQLELLRWGHPAYVTAGRTAPSSLRLPRPPRRPAGKRLAFAPGVVGRADTVRYRDRVDAHVAATGGTPLPPEASSYLRGTYADVGRPLVAGAEVLLDSPGLAEVAHELFDAEYVVPFTVFANVYLPGQELQAHTDVPAFRGAERHHVPPWLLVAMHHSGCFERWRIPVATVVVYPTPCRGGGFTYYPSDGATQGTCTIEPKENSAVALDADSVFHGVERVAGPRDALADLGGGAYLVPNGHRLDLCHEGPPLERVAAFSVDEVRFSASWKGYCFDDLETWRAWIDHSDDLDVDDVVPTLTSLLCERGTLPGPDHGLSDDELAVHDRRADPVPTGRRLTTRATAAQPSGQRDQWPRSRSSSGSRRPISSACSSRRTSSTAGGGSSPTGDLMPWRTLDAGSPSG